MRRALEEYSGVEDNFNDEEFLQWLAELAGGEEKR